MSKDKIIKFPITQSQRRKNMNGPLVVECEISGRQMKFHKNSKLLQGGEFITVDIMAMPIEDNIKSKKLCQLIVTKEDLLKAINSLEPEI